MKTLTRRLRILGRRFLPDESASSERRRMVELLESRERRRAGGRPYVPLSERVADTPPDWRTERLRQAIEGIYAAKKPRR